MQLIIITIKNKKTAFSFSAFQASSLKREKNINKINTISNLNVVHKSSASLKIYVLNFNGIIR